ncbi:MAG: endolytic transglycosylase MltG [Patescibacteria group bacterium]|nr:endolytic transglycosylase MltG [Patescibacteria group bacterium]
MKIKILILKVLISFIAILIIFYGWYNHPPRDFPKEITISLDKGATLKTISTLLEDKKIINSAFLFRIFIIANGGEKKVIEGDYLFQEKTSASDVAFRITHGKYGFASMRIVIFEGSTLAEMADKFESQLTKFNKNNFLRLTKGKEGYLFPDTYLLFPNTNEEQVIKIMTDNFDKKIASIKYQINAFGKPLKEVLTMASIVEKEASKIEDKKIIAGVLWKRIKIGMPLQVDVTFSYIYGVNTPKIYYNDLEIDSPYNLYKNKGLPPGPINNPGLDSIIATLNPVNTKYLYYLSDKNGVMHYAETHDQHVANKNKYLK